MSPVDIVILIMVAAEIGLSVAVQRRRRSHKGGGCGSCSACSRLDGCHREPESRDGADPGGENS